LQVKYRCKICGVYFSTIFDIMSHLQERHYVKVEYGDFIEEVPEEHDEPSLLSDLENIRCAICGRRIHYLKDDWVLHYRNRKFYHRECLEKKERVKEIQK